MTNKTRRTLRLLGHLSNDSTAMQLGFRWWYWWQQ